ncbi:MAG: YfhO family protein [Ignavibacteriales bacterium]
MATKTKKAPAASSRSEKIIPEKQSGFSNIIPEKYQTLASLVFLFILFLIYFAPMYFGGKTFESGDIVTSKSLVTYVTTHQDGFTLWNPYVFCGMPAYAMAVGFKWFNLIFVGITAVKWLFREVFSAEYAIWTLYLILLAFTSFFLMKYKTKNTLVSIFTAVASAFCTGLIIFLYLGHVTKLTSLCMYPLIFLILLKFQSRIRLPDAAVLIIALQLFVQGWHVQIIFYTLFAVGIYFLYYIIRSLIKKEKELTRQLFKSAGVFAAAAFIAILIQSDNLTQIYEYTPYSTRGAKSVVETKTNAREEPTSGSAYYDYHTMWSFSPGEIMTFIIPSYYGYGNSTYEGTAAELQGQRVPTYFGQMEAVDVPMYMGVLIFFFALFAMFVCWKDPFVQFLTLLSATGLLISFGKTFSPVFDLMFYHFPFFDKFRVPSMSLVLVQLSFPFLAGLGLNKIISLKKEKDERAEKFVRFAAITFTALFIVSLLLNSAIKDWFISRMMESGKAKMQAGYFKVISGYVSSMFISDMYIAFALTAGAFALAYAYTRSKVSSTLLVILVIGFTIFDLWRIDSRGANYIADTDISGIFREPDYVAAIKSRNDSSPFRLISLKQDGSYGSSVTNTNANYFAYFLLQDISGYSGIKPRAYQDILDALGGNAVNPTLWRMLNVKYVIFDKPVNFTSITEIYNSPQGVVYTYDPALPRAYFVNQVQTRPAVQILNMIRDNAFDPKETAFLEEGNLTVDRPDTTVANAVITSYKDEHIMIDAVASGNNFLFLGDTYFPKGWKALIDGSETRIYRANHGFRGIVVPKGRHKVEFIYAPVSFQASKIISLSLSSLVVIVLLSGLFLPQWKKYKSRIFS